MVPVVCGGCGLRGTVALAKLAAANNPQCPRCGSRELDLDERTAADTGTNYRCKNCGKEITHTAEGWIHVGGDAYCDQSAGDAKATPGEVNAARRTAELGEPTRKDCPQCGTNNLMKVTRSDGKEVWNCTQCNYQSGAGPKGGAQFLDKSSKLAFNDPPLDTLSDTDQVIEKVTCSNCLQSFNHAVSDPADPLPPCPNCGSMATSVAGPTSVHAVLDAKAAELVDAILATNPGMSRGAAQSLAYRTIERYPKIAGLPKPASHATVPMDPAEIERRRTAPHPEMDEDMPHAIDQLLHNRWHTPA